MKKIFFYVVLSFLLIFLSCSQASFEENEVGKNDNAQTDTTLQVVDFSVGGSENLTIPLDEEVTTSVTLYNNGDDKDSYSISTDSELAKVKLSKKSVSLNGKSHITIEITAKVTEEKDTIIKVIFQSKNNPEIKREHLIKVNAVDNDFSVQTDVSYYTKGIESQIKVTLTNNTKQPELVYLRFDKVPSFVQLRRLPMLVMMSPGEKVTLDFPYTVNIDCDNKINFDFLVYSGNGKRLRQTKEITLWDLTSRLVSLTNEDDTKSQIDLTEEAKSLQEKFRTNDYIQANEIAMEMVSKLADFAGVEQTEPENDMYFIDADEPEVRIEVPQTPAIFSQNVGEFKIIAAENAVSDACLQSGVTHPNNLFYIDGVAYYLQKNGEIYTPTKKFVKGVPLLKEDGTEKGISYFKYEKTVTVNMKSHTTSGNSGGYEYDTFEEDQRKATEGYWKIQTASQQDSSGVTTSCTYALYSAHTAVCFEVTEEADDSREFLAELDNVPTDRIVIFTHGTLFYKWVAEAKQHGNYYMFCEDGEGNTAKFFKQPSVANALNLDYSQNDKAYYFNWSGENNYDHRDKAAVALEKFIYDKISTNLFNCRASQIILIGHSHGVTVNNITMHNLQTDKMEKFAGEIPFVVGLNGIGTSTGSNTIHQSGVNALAFFGAGLFPPGTTFGISYAVNTANNEKSNRDCFKFPDKTFESLDGDKKVKMYNFYSDQDGVVPPAFDDTIIFSYNYKWEYTVQELLNYTTVSIARSFAIVQAVRFIVVACISGNHNIYRSEALTLDNSFANINERDFKNSSHDDFYSKYMNPPVKLWNICDYIERVTTSLSHSIFIDLMNLYFHFSQNGDFDLDAGNGIGCQHQLSRIHDLFLKCISKIDSELIEDKEVKLSN